ncbi:MAG: iron ABC transporter permease [Chloroflexi bacterium]|nr:iron ABC transporter permease [Chloroflexota bacterium]
MWAAPLVFLVVFFFQPLWTIFRLAFQTGLAEGLTAGDWLRVWRPLGFTFWQAGLSTLLTLLVGLPAAYLFSRFVFPGKQLLRVVVTLPFILPTVVVAAGFNALLGPRGWVNLGLMALFDLSSPPVQMMNTLGAILLAHVFYNTSVIIRVVSTAWSQLDVRLENAARVLGASPLRAFFEVTFPLLRPAIFSAALLVFLFDFTSFGVILLLGGPAYRTIEVEIYIQALQMLNLPLAGLLSAIQLAATLVLTWIYSRISGGQQVPLIPRLKGEGQRRPKGWKEKLLAAGMVAVLAVLLVSPLAAMSLRSVTRLDAERGQRSEVQRGLTLDYYRELFVNRRESLFYVPPIEAARNSLQYAGATVLISVTLGVLASYALNRHSGVNKVLEPLFMLPLGASAVTLGLGFILVFNHPPLDVRTFPWLLPIAHSLVALPFVVRSVQPALAAVPERLREAAKVLGAPGWRVWLEVDLPILSRAVLVSGIFAFTISLGEFGATSFLARPEYPTMPVAIYRFLSQPGALNYGQALAMSTLLMLVCAASILLIERIRLPGISEL